MGEGLKRAGADAARSRGAMSGDMVRFLAEVDAYGKPLPPGRMAAWATAADGKARQQAKRIGYANRIRDEHGRWAWEITRDGKVALDKARAAAA